MPIDGSEKSPAVIREHLKSGVSARVFPASTAKPVYNKEDGSLLVRHD
jgi:hypothetical protein